MTVPEILRARLGCCENPDVFDAQQVELIDSTAADLLAGVTQMLHETEGGTWRPGPEQPDLKRKLADLDVVLNSRIVDAYLAGHAELAIR